MTPPTHCELPIGWLNRKWLVHTVGRGLAPAKTYRFWIFWLNGSRSKPGPSGGGEPPPYGTSRQIPICRTLGNAGQHISKSSPEGIPHLISDISYLISPSPAPPAPGDTRCVPARLVKRSLLSPMDPPGKSVFCHKRFTYSLLRREVENVKITPLFSYPYRQLGANYVQIFR